MSEIANFIGITVPLITIAGSAVAYLYQIFVDSRQTRRSEFFELMKALDDKGTIASKMVAVYELRNYPEHRDFIVRFLKANRDQLSGGASGILRSEFDNCLTHFGERAD